MPLTSRLLMVLLLVCFGAASRAADGVTPQAAASLDALPLFAVQVMTGDKWDAAKPPHEQALFREHSANLKRLREAGHLIVGARYSDVGLIILAAESETHARAMMDADPSFSAGTFRYEVHRLNVFYPGTVRTAAAK
jgi:uncharacterized protein YciI